MNKWPYQSTPYLSALPGVGGPGLDVGAGDLPSKLYFVTSLENEKVGGPDPRGPNCFSGTFEWCWYADQGEGFHKWIFPLVSGYVYRGRGMLSPERANFDYIGHAAPGAGLFVQTGTLTVRGSNSRIWHLPSWVGDLPSVNDGEYKADQRDALQASSSDNDINRVAFINCEARFSMDEAVQVYYDAQGTSWIRGAIYDPLHIPPDFGDPDIQNHEPGTDHGYGHLVGGKADYSLVMQSLYAHTTDRNPLVGAPNHAHINNLHYNHGRATGGRGEALNIDDNGEHNLNSGLTMQCNCVGNVTVRGPEQSDSLTLAKVMDVTAGSSGHSANNSCFGWPSPYSQAGFFHEQPAGYLQPTLRRGAWPLGLGFNYDGVLRPCADPLHPRVQEGLAFSQLIRETVGCMPARRYLVAGGVNRVMDQIDAAIRGITQAPQYVNTVDEAGGWPQITEYSIDPANPSTDYHAPMPLGEERDEVMLFGSFSDGTSMVGYSRLRAWCIEQYFYVMGR